MQSENTAAQEMTTPDGDDATASVDLTSLHDLLAEPEPAKTPDGENGAASGNTEQKAKPKMFNDLAESLGIELNDLYALQVSTVDGKTVTIEELKALQSTQDDITIRELEFEENKSSKEGDLRQAQNELAEIVAALPDGTIKPEVLNKLRAKNAARTEVEQSRTLEAIPTWRDETIRTKDLTGMAAHLERFGFPANHIASVTDHRQLVFIRESFLREQRIKTALGRVRAGAPNPTTPTKTSGKAPAKAGAARKNSNTRNGLESFFSEVT
jgi:hypothetical protein